MAVEGAKRGGRQQAEGRGSHVLSLDRRSVGLPEYVVRFVAQGLHADDRVLWIEPFPTADRVRQLLAAHGIDVARYESEGRLVFRPLAETLAGGSDFEAAAALEALRDELMRAARRGSGALRLVQDLCGPRPEPLAEDALREYEAGVDALVSRYPLDALCVYDLGRASPLQAMVAVGEHPHLLERGRAVSNPFCTPVDADAPEEALHRLELFLRYREGRTATRRHAALVRLLRGIVVQTGQATSHESAVELSLRELCRFTGWPVGHAFRPDPETGVLRPSRVSYTADQSRYAAFIEVASRVDPAREPGLAGRVLRTGKPAWISDLARDPDFPTRDEARRAGLHSAVALPVAANGKVLTVLEFFAPGHEDPDPDRLDVLQYVAMALGRVLEFIRVEAELSRSERRFRALVESAADAILIVDQDGRIVSSNPAAARLFGHSPRELAGHSLDALLPARLVASYEADLSRLMAGEAMIDGRVVEIVGRAKDGREFPLEVSLASWVEDRRYFSAILREVTDRKEAESELRLLGSAVANVRDAIVITTAGDDERPPTIRYANQAFTRMTGFSESEVLGRGFDLLVGPKTDRDALGTVYDRLADGKAAATEIVAYHRDGSDFLLEWSASPIHDADGSTPYFVSIQRDVTGERIAQMALRRVDRDALTGLANRDVLVERLRRAIERATERSDQRYALLFMDLDGFKAINDEQGHVFGDRVLKSVAQRLQQSVRPGDTVARFGGDEFVVLLDHVAEISDVVIVAERIQDAVRQPLAIRGRGVRVGARSGSR